MPCALALVAIIAGYLFWLASSVLARSKLPVWTDAIPWTFLILTLFAGSLAPRPVPKGVATSMAPERVVYDAMSTLGKALAGFPFPCAEPEKIRRLLADRERYPLAGYRAHGFLLDYQVRIDSERNGPIPDVLPGARPGTLQVACQGKQFWITGVVLDLRRNMPTMLLQPIGGLAVITRD